MVGLDGWQFGFADQATIPEERKSPVAMQGEYDELITLSRVDGVTLNVFTLR
jgi:hypothetical protein